MDFTTKVAEGRHLPQDKVLQIAKGRIWSGQDAKNLGLIDELGGYDTALKVAKKAAGIPEGKEVKIVVFPKKKSLWQSIMQREGPENSEKEAVGQAMVQVLQSIQPLAHQLNVTNILDNGNREGGEDVLRMRALEPGR